MASMVVGEVEEDGVGTGFRIHNFSIYHRDIEPREGEKMLCLGGLGGLHGDNIFNSRLEKGVEGGGLATKELKEHKAEEPRATEFDH